MYHPPSWMHDRRVVVWQDLLVEIQHVHLRIISKIINERTKEGMNGLNKCLNDWMNECLNGITECLNKWCK